MMTARPGEAGDFVVGEAQDNDTEPRPTKAIRRCVDITRPARRGHEANPFGPFLR